MIIVEAPDILIVEIPSSRASSGAVRLAQPSCGRSCMARTLSSRSGPGFRSAPRSPVSLRPHMRSRA